jgi:hypothetical protein
MSMPQHRRKSACGLWPNKKENIPMKRVSKRLLYSIITIALLAPLSATALIVGARVAEVTQSDGNDLLLVALALGGAALSALNGLGRRMAGLERAPGHAAKPSRRPREMVHLNY